MFRREMVLPLILVGLSASVSHGWVSPGNGQYYTMDTAFPKVSTDITYATEDVVWDTTNGCYLVLDTLTITNQIAPDELLISPGTVVKFQPGMSFGLEVEGILRAQGTETDTIVFTSSAAVPDSGDWEAVRFLPASIDSSCVVSYCLLEYGRLAINAQRASPTISHNRIVNNAWFGVMVGFEGAPEISDNLIEGNGRYGIGCGGAASPVIARNILRDNHYRGIDCIDSTSPLVVENHVSGATWDGIYCANRTTPTIIRNTITNNTWGIAVRDSAAPLIGGSMENANDIYGNSDWEIYNRTSDTVRAEFNYWGAVDEGSILARIFDYEDGYIDYVPWVNAEHDTAYESGQSPVADAGGPYTGDEGSTIIFSGSGSSDDHGIVAWEWDLDGDGMYDSTGESTGGVWSDDCTATIVLRVTDTEGLSDIDSTTVVVRNVPPSADAGGPYAAAVDEEIRLGGAAHDPGLDALTYEWDLDEDGEFDDATVPDPSHLWQSAGAYTVHLRVTDDDGGVGTDSAAVTVVEESPSFVRADANADSEISMADVVFTVRYIYVPGSPVPPCMKAADTDDNGEIQMSDVLYTLRYVYIPGSPEPPYPFPDCGSDPTPDGLDYGSHPCMESRSDGGIPVDRGNERGLD